MTTPNPIVRRRSGRITLAEARALFGQIRQGRPLTDADLAAEFGKVADQWNWFRVGIRLGELGKVRSSDVERLRDQSTR